MAVYGRPLRGKKRTDCSLRISRPLPDTVWKDGYGEALLWQLITGEKLNDNQLDRKILEHRLRLLFRTPPGMA
ncbi:MAG TPA: hypothetical protein PKX93_07475 [bacterium]|nr:hypothetical protein [bacterium]